MLDFVFLLDFLIFSILSIVWFFLSAFLCRDAEIHRVTPLQKCKGNSNFIDNKLLKAHSYTIDIYSQDKYIIDGIDFEEKINLNKKYKEFELYKTKMDDSDTSGVSIDDDTHLQLTLELVPNGFIINSNVYLSHNQWHTICPMSEQYHRCAVCDQYCEGAAHIGNSGHVANMQRYRPLHKYDLTITRKINTNFHCGVCNVIFDETQKNEHFSSKSHEDKLLFAINRVSDIMYDFNLHHDNNNEKRDSYYFNAKHNHKEDAYMLEPDSVETEDEIDEYEYNDDDWCPLNNGNDFNDEEYSDEEYGEVQNLEFSYATMAKKPKSDDLPDVLEVDLGNKKVTVKYNSWNMINRMANRFYCMACKELDHIRRRAEHCNSEGHQARLDACTVVDKYEKYFVRQVDDKCYHCGHCNNLQLINVMEDHILSVHTHPTTVHHTILDSPAKKISGKTKTNEDLAKNVQANSEQALAINDQTKTNFEYELAKNGQIAKNIIIDPVSVFEGLKAANSTFEDIVICTYGSNLRISKLAFNIICQGKNEFYCGLCEVNIEGEMLRYHVMDPRHLHLLHRTPFLQAFNIHLFRQIRDALHCGLCNELVQIMPEFIIKHKYLEKHIISLHRAMGYFQNEAHTNVTNNNNFDIAKPALKTPEITKTNINNVTNVNKTNITADETKKDVASSIPTQNAKIVALNKNISIAIANCNKNESLTNKNKVNNDKNVIDAKNGIVTAKVIENVRNGAFTAKSLSKEKPNEIIEDQNKTEQFITVRNGVKEDIEQDFDDSYIEDFDLEEYVYVKLGNSYIKITNTSYNTLVDVGDGSKYCFVCSCVVWELSKHVESRGHMDNMEKIKFVDKYNEDLLRQFYLMYHCSICNVVITRKQLSHHLSWPTHALQTENTKIASKKRKNEIKTGTKHVTATTQKENIYLNEKETDIKIFLHVTIEKDKHVEKLNKIVIFNDNVLKVSFDSWNGLSEANNGYRCKVCQSDFGAEEFGVHVTSEWHKGHLDKIEKQYSPALIRKINDTTLNCVMCNTEVSNKKHIITEHIQGKKHIKNYETILKESSVANSYSDCDQDVVML